MTERGCGATLAESTATATATATATSTVHGIQGVTALPLRVRAGDGGHLIPQLKLQGQLGDPPVQQPHGAADEQQGGKAGQKLG